MTIRSGPSQGEGGLPSAGGEEVQGRKVGRWVCVCVCGGGGGGGAKWVCNNDP